ncbi:MAG: hypothetical protein RJR37_02720 [Peptococcaceae bacterium MAG4]|nr:hypothetical protein [Peptococcaceae bacterium MAG4]
MKELISGKYFQGSLGNAKNGFSVRSTKILTILAAAGTEQAMFKPETGSWFFRACIAAQGGHG